MARNKRLRPYNDPGSRHFALFSLFRRRVIEKALARVSTRRFKAAARRSTHLLSTTPAEGGRNLGNISTVDQLTASDDERSKNSGIQSSVRRHKTNHARENVEVSRHSGNAQEPHHQSAFISFSSGRRDESSVEPGTSRASKLSKDQNESQDSTRRPRSHKSGGGKSHRSSSGLLSTIRDGGLVYSSDNGAAAYAPDLDLHLPQSADDDAISREVRSLFYYVAQHVGTFYIDRFCDFVPPLAMVQLKCLHSPLPDSPLDEIVEDTPCQQAIIEHCLNFLLLSSISMEYASHQPDTREADGLPTYPLLPADFTALLQATARSSAGPCSLKCYGQALSKLRVLSSYLVPDIANDEMYRKQKEEMIVTAASAFSQAFSPWENPKTEPGARLIQLKVIFNRAADLGILMFSQPSVFRFDWTPGEVVMKSDEIAVSPWLFKIADENGMALPRPQKMINIKLSALPMLTKVDDAAENLTPPEVQRDVPQDRNQSKRRRRRKLEKSGPNNLR